MIEELRNCTVFLQISTRSKKSFSSCRHLWKR